MLRQTLEYELTLLRTQHGKQTAFTHQLQNQFNQSNEQIKQLHEQLNLINQQKENQIKEKDQKIKQLEAEAETLHDRERFLFIYLFFNFIFLNRRIEALNEQIQKMESTIQILFVIRTKKKFFLGTFSDSESLSRKNLAQSILAKERETELKREYEVIQIKLQYSEQALEQERAISNEAKLNVQLLTVNFI